MQLIADLHIHSRFSRATSKRININEISRYAEIKGLSLVGTGDFTHPKWIKELEEDLSEEPGSGIYKSTRGSGTTNFIISGEVSTVFTYKGKTKKIHHLILTPSFEVASQINDRLQHYGDLSIDGRPILDLSASMLVEELMDISLKNEVIPAHIWTPWFSLFGAISGFDRIEECYQDMTKHLHAVETGLSSDPLMNWRLSVLDKFTLLSNSDSHSCWPWRIGREANVFNFEKQKATYNDILNTIRRKDPGHLKFTIEADPAYGKYHWTGHRQCNVSMSPREAIRYGDRCPVCHGKLTKGVEQRVNELADRSTEYRPPGAIDYMHLLPLSEIIAFILKVSSPYLPKVWELYNSLITKFGNEYTVLIDTPEAEISKVAGVKIAEAIMRVRHDKARVIPGYDGVYGQLSLFEEKTEETGTSEFPQRVLSDWCT